LDRAAGIATVSAFVPRVTAEPFGMRLLETYFGRVSDGFAEARTSSEYRALGEALSQLLRELAEAAHVSDPDRIPAPDLEVEHWAEITARTVFNDQDVARRRVFVAQLASAWTAASDLAADPTATRADAETTMYLCSYALEFGTHVIGRYLQPRPDVCPNCGAPHLAISQTGVRCLDCGWYGTTALTEI
jgi:hypothetical protein